MDSAPKVRVLVADSLPATRYAMALLVNSHSGTEVCGVAVDAPIARELCAKLKPGIVVFDLRICRGGGLELLGEFKRLHESAVAVIWSEEENSQLVQRAFHLGAMVYLSKHDETSTFLTGLDHALKGSRYASPRLTHLLVGLCKCDGIARQQISAALSDRELCIFSLIGRGMGTTAIARDLGICLKTVETHKRNIKEKLNLITASELQRRAESWGAGVPIETGEH